MRAFVVFVVSCLAFASASDLYESCYNKIEQTCSQSGKAGPADSDLIGCNATYGHIHIVMKDLVNYANSHIFRSNEYLLMATHYANYQKNRVGFEKLFRGLSDSKWHEAIELIKHVTKRGGVMSFAQPSLLNVVDKKPVYELYEIQSMAKALDTEKQLALEAFNIHKEASGRSEGKHDPEVASYIEEEFVHEHAKTVRKLAGYVTDLKSMLSGPDGSLALYLFDEYLQKE